MAEGIKKYLFKPGAAPQVEVIDLETLAAQNRKLLTSPHRTNFYHIFLLDDCSPQHMVDFITVDTNPFSLLFIDRDRVQQFDRELNYNGRLVVFTDDFFCTHESDAGFLRSTSLFNNLTGRPELEIGPDLYKKLLAITDDLLAESTIPTSREGQEIMKNLLHNFLLLAEREKQKQAGTETKTGGRKELTLLYKKLLDAEYSRIKNVSTYAEMLNVTEKQLGQATAKWLGKTPKQMIDERVLLEAKRLLVHGKTSIKEVGFLLGFDEPTNFIKYFRKHEGITPADFRKKYIPAANIQGAKVSSKG